MWKGEYALGLPSVKTFWASIALRRQNQIGLGNKEGEKKKAKKKSLYRGKVIHLNKCQIIEHLHKLISASWCPLSARLIKDNLITPAVWWSCPVILCYISTTVWSMFIAVKYVTCCLGMVMQMDESCGRREKNNYAISFRNEISHWSSYYLFPSLLWSTDIQNHWRNFLNIAYTFLARMVWWALQVVLGL